MSERPVRDRPRRPADWLNPIGDKKVHSSEEQASKRKGLAVARFRSADLNQATRGWGSRPKREPFTRCEPGVVIHSKDVTFCIVPKVRAYLHLSPGVEPRPSKPRSSG